MIAVMLLYVGCGEFEHLCIMLHNRGARVSFSLWSLSYGKLLRYPLALSGSGCERQ